MTKLECSVKNCLHNADNCCCKAASTMHMMDETQGTEHCGIWKAHGDV